MGLGSHSKIVLKFVDFQVKLYATTTPVVSLNKRNSYYYMNFLAHDFTLKV